MNALEEESGDETRIASIFYSTKKNGQPKFCDVIALDTWDSISKMWQKIAGA